MKLSIDQVFLVRQYVQQSGIANQGLQDDLIDHLCCAIEFKIEHGTSLPVALEEAVNELAPEGLITLQLETVFLLNSTKIIRMKKVMYTIGALSVMLFVLGWCFGMMGWAGARELSIFGFLGFVFLYAPLLIVDRFKTRIRWVLSEKLKFILGTISGFVLALAVFFKIMHLPGADQLLLLGTGLFTFGFVPFLFFTMYKKSVS
jgi:hypothetical protein